MDPCNAERFGKLVLSEKRFIVDALFYLTMKKKSMFFFFYLETLLETLTGDTKAKRSAAVVRRKKRSLLTKINLRTRLRADKVNRLHQEGETGVRK